MATVVLLLPYIIWFSNLLDLRYSGACFEYSDFLNELSCWHKSSNKAILLLDWGYHSKKKCYGHLGWWKAVNRTTYIAMACRKRTNGRSINTTQTTNDRATCTQLKTGDTPDSWPSLILAISCVCLFAFRAPKTYTSQLTNKNRTLPQKIFNFSIKTRSIGTNPPSL
jgi:hypothetical protein